MEAFLLIYNVILTCLYVVPMLLSFLFYQRNKRYIYLYTTVVFGAFALDEIVICMTEFVPWFSEFYKGMLLSVPSFKTIIYFLTFLFTIRIIETIMEEGFPLVLYIGLVTLIVFLLFVPGVGDSSLKLWLYYSASSAFAIIIGIRGLYYFRKIPKQDRTDTQNYLHKVLLLVVVFYIIVTLEDSFTLFDPNSFLHRSTRSISEDIFRIIITITTTVFLVRKIVLLLKNSNVKDVEIFAGVNIDKSDSVATQSEDKEVEKKETYSKFYLFCKEYQLTPREQDILLLIVDNKSNDEISEALVISIGTAKTHIHNIYAKLNVKRRRELLSLYDEFQIEEE